MKTIRTFSGTFRLILLVVCAIPLSWARVGAEPTKDPDHDEIYQGPPTPETTLAFELWKQGQRSLDAGKRDEAFALFQKALRVDPHVIPVNFSLGDIYFERHQYAAAEGAYKRASTGATDTTAQFRLALVYSRSGRYREAVEAYQSGIGGLGSLPADIAPVLAQPISPRPADMPTLEAAIALYRGWESYSSSQDAKAAPFFRDAIRLRPNVTEPHLLLGLLLQRSGKRDRRDEARAELKKAVALGMGHTAELADHALKSFPQ